MKIKFAIYLLVILMLLPYVVVAQSTNPCATGTSGNIGKCMSKIYIWSIGVSGVLAVGAFIWGAYLLMTSRGNGNQASNGKSYMYSALGGMVLLLGAYLLLNTINTDLTDFKTPDFNLINNTSPRQ